MTQLLAMDTASFVMFTGITAALLFVAGVVVYALWATRKKTPAKT